MDWNFASEEAYIEQGNLERGDYRNIKKVHKRKAEITKSIVFWEQKDGSKIDIDKMTIEHLRNTLRMIVTRELLKDKEKW